MGRFCLNYLKNSTERGRICYEFTGFDMSFKQKKVIKFLIYSIFDDLFGEVRHIKGLKRFLWINEQNYLIISFSS